MRQLWQSVTRALKAIGRVQSAILLSIVYLVLWVPVGLVTRLCADWLQRRPPAQSGWRPRAPRLNEPSHVNEPF